MNIEERTRLAAAMVPKPGAARYAARAWIVGVVVFVGGALRVLTDLPELPTPGHLLALVALISLGVADLAFALELLGQLRAHQRATRWALAGQFERASEAQLALLERRWVLPEWRSVFAISLGATALMAGHAERAIVLLRAVEASGTVTRLQRGPLRDTTALTLFALGETSAARAIVAEGNGAARMFGLQLPRTQVGLVIEAIAGSLESAIAAASVAEEQFQLPLLAPRDSYPAIQRAYGWLLIAYAWERVARSKPAEARGDAERRRDEAIARARDVPRSFYRYLAPRAPDFVDFADRFAT